MERIIDGMPHIHIDEAAAALQTTNVRILMLIRQNVMRGCQADGEWYVEMGWLSCFRSHDPSEAVERKECPSSCRGCSGS